MGHEIFHQQYAAIAVRATGSTSSATTRAAPIGLVFGAPTTTTRSLTKDLSACIVHHGRLSKKSHGIVAGTPYAQLLLTESSLTSL